MITVIGFIAGLMPHIFSLFKELKEYKLAKLDQAHELAVMQLQIQIAELDLENQMKEAEINATVSNSEIVHTAFKSDNKIVNAINNLIRPLIVLCFLGSYVYIQFAIVQRYLEGGIPLSALSDLLWTDNEQAMLNAILTFYFGNFVRGK